MLPIVPIINVPMPTFCQLFVVFIARPAHLAYWGNHPRAVCILEKHREKLNTWLDACQVSTFFLFYILIFNDFLASKTSCRALQIIVCVPVLRIRIGDPGSGDLLVS
jgi:hypothetical protein